MLRSLARSFVVTVAVTSAACRKDPDTARPDLPSPKPDGIASTSDSASTTVASVEPPPGPTKKRKRSADAGAPWKIPKGPTPSWSDLDPRNSTTADGHAIFVRDDDICYFEVPMKKPPKMMPTGFRQMDQVPIDCPPELDDPAWDECSYSTLMAPKTPPGDCYCFSLGGNPPPPPRLVHCPKK